MRSQEFRLRYVIHRFIDFIGGSMHEPDGTTPSSARMIAVMIFTALTFLTAGIITGFVHMTVETSESIAQVAATGKSTADLTKVIDLLTHAIVTITLWWFLFLAATALSLYGINVWKWVASIRAGVMPNDEGKMGAQNFNASVAEPAAVAPTVEASQHPSKESTSGGNDDEPDKLG
jgi:hypothetical protein